MEKYFLLTKNGARWVATKWSNVSLTGLRNDLSKMQFNIIFLPKDYTIGKMYKEKSRQYTILTPSDVLAIVNEENLVNYITRNTYELTELNRCTLVAWSDNPVNVEILKEFCGLPVTSIGTEAFKEHTTLESVIIPETVELIKKRAFLSCERLKKVTLPKSLSSIHSFAFMGCINLTEVLIPREVKFIGYKALGFIDEIGVVEGFTISGYTGSEAEEYAKRNGFEFVALLDECDVSEKGLCLDIEFCSQPDKIHRCFCCGELITDSYYCTIYFKESFAHSVNDKEKVFVHNECIEEQKNLEELKSDILKSYEEFLKLKEIFEE
jgi:hypothetical protein